MRRTTKYDMFIETDTFNGNYIPLTKKNYLETLHNFKAQAHKPKDMFTDCNGTVEREVTITDFYNIVSHTFRDKNIRITLRKHTATNGYSFT